MAHLRMKHMLMDFMGILSRPVPETLLLYKASEMKICFIIHEHMNNCVWLTILNLKDVSAKLVSCGNVLIFKDSHNDCISYPFSVFKCTN